MADYSRLTAQDLGFLLSRYDLGRIEEAVPLTGGQANTSYRIQFSTGTYALSVCDEKNEPQTRTLVWLTAYLAGAGFPCPCPVPAGNGQMLFSFKGKPLYLKTFLAGRVVQDLSLTMLTQAGQALARLHQTPLPPELRAALPTAPSLALDQWDLYVPHPFALWLEEKKAFLSRHLDLSLDQGLIHGDLFWDNLIFDQGKLTGVLDFEEACLYPCLFDLGMAILGCCQGKDKLDLIKARALIQGYETLGPLSGHGREQLRYYFIYAAAVAAFWRFRQYNLLRPCPEKQESYRELTLLAEQAQETPGLL